MKYSRGSHVNVKIVEEFPYLVYTGTHILWRNLGIRSLIYRSWVKAYFQVTVLCAFFGLMNLGSQLLIQTRDYQSFLFLSFFLPTNSFDSYFTWNWVNPIVIRSDFLKSYIFINNIVWNCINKLVSIFCSLLKHKQLILHKF